MGEAIKQPTTSDNDKEGLDKIDDLMDDVNRFADTLAKGMADARTAIETKNKVENSGAKKKSAQDSKQSSKDGDNMDFEIEDITSAIDKMIALKGNMELSEAKTFIEENEDMVKDLI